VSGRRGKKEGKKEDPEKKKGTQLAIHFACLNLCTVFRPSRGHLFIRAPIAHRLIGDNYFSPPTTIRIPHLEPA
jgi:hypothetical protein